MTQSQFLNFADNFTDVLLDFKILFLNHLLLKFHQFHLLFVPLDFFVEDRLPFIKFIDLLLKKIVLGNQSLILLV